MPRTLHHPLFRGLLLAALAGGLLLLDGGRVRATEPLPLNAAPGRSSIYSSDRRFVVSGLTSSENMVLVRQLSALAARIEKMTGMPLPFDASQVLGVMVQSSPKPGDQPLKIQGWDGGRFYQRLVVPGGPLLDMEDLMGAASWLLLNRYAAEYTPQNRRSGIGAEVPDWISSGAAQQTQPALCSRNREWIAGELDAGKGMALSKVIKQELLPPGRWREKAYAAEAVDFLFPAGDFTTWAMLFKAVGRGQAINAAWLRQYCPALRAEGVNPETLWAAFLEERARSRTAETWSDRGLLLESKLLDLLNFSPRYLASDVPADVPTTLYAGDLMAFRSQSWVAPAAASLSLQVQSLMLGAPTDLQRVLAAYTAYFDLFSKPPEQKKPWWRRKKNDSGLPADDEAWQLGLSQLWMRAERAHQAFLESHQSRKRYVDSFDRPDPSDWNSLPDADPDVPRTSAQQYVDEVERAFVNGGR